jgi:predicted permease
VNLRERLGAVVADLRYAARRFGRAPSFVLVAMVTLALGIGANITVFTWMDGLVLHPLPLVKDVARLVALQTGTPSGGSQSVSYPDYLDWSTATALSDVVAYRRQELSLRTSASGDAESVWGVLVSSNYFDVLGVRLVRGRTFRPEESSPRGSAGGAPVAIIGYDMWQRTFGAREDVIGSSIFLNGHPLTIIGVAPPGFHGGNVGFSFDLWAPLTMQPTLTAQPLDKLTWRRSRWISAVAKLAPGASLERARAELKTIGIRISAEHVEDKDVRPVVVPLLDAEASSILEPIFVALLGATGIVLAIVVFNLAGLQLVRSLARRQELAVRLTLGASRSRIVQQFLIEALLLACIAAPAAMVVSLWARGLLAHFLTHTTFPLAATPSLTGRVLLYAVLVTFAVVVTIGTWPALHVSSRARPGLATSSGGNRSMTGQGRAREVLVVAQLALSLAGVASAGLLVHSLARLRGTGTGLVDPGHVLLASTDFDLAGAGFAGLGDDPAVRARRLPVAMDLLRRARAMNGVRTAALTDSPPLGLVNGFDSFDIQIPGYVPAPNETMSSEIAYVTPDYFSTVGPTVARGRSFRDEDRAGSAAVIAVNEAFAARYWPIGEPALTALGKTVHLGGRDATIVGVVRDAKYHWVSESPRPFVYLPYAQWSPSSLTIALRAEGDPLALVAPLRRVFHEANPALPMLDPRTLDDQIEGALTLQRLGAALLASLATLALAIAGLGLYAALMQAVQQRQREIGIRMALGARAVDVLAQFTRRGLVVAGAGILLGAPIVFVAGRLLRKQIYGIAPTDPLSLAVTGVIFAVVVIAASFVTALRASRVDPAASIRVE